MIMLKLMRLNDSDRNTINIEGTVEELKNGSQEKKKLKTDYCEIHTASIECGIEGD